MKTYYKRLTRTISVPCPACWGCIDNERTCATCNGTGEVSRTVNELKPVEGDEDSDALLGWAGSVL